MAESAPKFTLLSDQPYAGDDDPLEFGALAENLDQEPADRDALLERLESNVPEQFAELAAHEGFASLVEGLGSAEEWPELRVQLASGRSPVLAGEEPAVADEIVPDEVIPEGALACTSVLWVDDNPEYNRQYTQELESGGATVFTAVDTEQARTVLDHGDVDVLISDVGRQDRRDAGFEDLRAWREAGIAPAAAFFFTSHLSRAGREAAAALDAEVMSDPAVLLLRIRVEAEVGDHDARKVLAALLDSRWEFRTAEGIAKQTAVPLEQVQAVLAEYPQFVRESPVPDRAGARLFAARSAAGGQVPAGA